MPAARATDDTDGRRAAHRRFRVILSMAKDLSRTSGSRLCPKDPSIASLIQDDKEKDIRVIRGREAASVSSVSLGTEEAGSLSGPCT